MLYAVRVVVGLLEGPLLKGCLHTLLQHLSVLLSVLFLRIMRLLRRRIRQHFLLILRGLLCVLLCLHLIAASSMMVSRRLSCRLLIVGLRTGRVLLWYRPWIA